MPEAVQSFAENRDFNEVRDIQKRILAAYEQDFSKHAPYEIVPRIRMLWNSIPSQLAKENKKFIYGLIREGPVRKTTKLQGRKRACQYSPVRHRADYCKFLTSSLTSAAECFAAAASKTG